MKFLLKLLFVLGVLFVHFSVYGQSFCGSNQAINIDEKNWLDYKCYDLNQIDKNSNCLDWDKYSLNKKNGCPGKEKCCYVSSAKKEKFLASNFVKIVNKIKNTDRFNFYIFISSLMAIFLIHFIFYIYSFNKNNISIQISAQLIQIPFACVCCSSKNITRDVISSHTKTKGVKVIKYETKEILFRYCENCYDHIVAFNKAQTIVYLIYFLNFVLIFGSIFTELWFNLFFILFVIFINLLGFLSALNNFFKSLKLKKDNCVCLINPVVYNGWYGSVHNFIFYNINFSLMFMEANKNKLVNQSIYNQKILNDYESNRNSHAE